MVLSCSVRASSFNQLTHCNWYCVDGTVRCIYSLPPILTLAVAFSTVSYRMVGGSTAVYWHSET